MRNTPQGMRYDIQLVSGNYFDFMQPEKCDFTIYDIAHGLSNICRFGGQSCEFYSVAQHSVYVSKLVAPEHAFAALMHDAAEAFIGDVCKPLKMLLPDYQEIEKRVEVAVLNRFGLSSELHPSIKQADLIMLATEQKALMPPNDGSWILLKGIKPLQMGINPMRPKSAYAFFMERFWNITKYTPKQVSLTELGPEFITYNGVQIENRK